MSEVMKRWAEVIGSPKKLGKPRRFRSPEHLMHLADEYVFKCMEKEVPVTISSITLYLGFYSIPNFLELPQDRGADYEPCIPYIYHLVENWLQTATAGEDKVAGKKFLLETLHDYRPALEPKQSTDIHIHIDSKDAQL